jgi:uncharacterized membrane protein HdeD (DUF308 family)
LSATPTIGFVTEQPPRPSRARFLGWGLALALVALPVAWLDVYLLSTEDASAEYVVGRYSLLLGAASAITLVVERLRHLTPWAALAGTVLAWLGVLLGKALDTGATAYPWVIAGAAAIAVAAAGMPGAHRPGAARAAALLAVTSAVGLLGLA